ncbi:MAG: acyl carrier protein [Proteobacteria bacterium]|nr:acyl carrier protein [Pseudomonadota bacterium]MBU1649294.1 acyl carrier protein [Pseudomonadota bacterium]MBU1986868.1 acyl carrier protein [Pseudomonadota bacterium]
MDNKTKLKAFLQELLTDYGKETDIGDDDLLVTSGLLDSLAVLRMVVFLEEEFGLDLAERGFDQNDFDSLSNIMRLVSP